MASVKTQPAVDTDRYHDYDPFAWLYSHYWGAEYHEQILPALDRAVLGRLARNAKILDLCCGDGRLAARLTQRGYVVTGVDGSPDMLEIARRNAPSARFVLGDARQLRIPGEFEAVVSTFDSLNHVLKADELRAVFRGVHQLLAKDGSFVFDLNREEAYVELWPQTFPLVRPDVVTVNQSDYDRKQGLATCRIVQFRNTAAGWQRSDFTLTQRHHPRAAVISALQQAGFTSVDSFDADADLGMKGQIGRYRTFYLAQK
ncbi:MAG: Methyltransferase type 11 [Bryobacterales bacterium]|jgi:SAM-dependent methyltransferase|nr:Methyltransferase type 11 [Bryobacterales bacterium]